MLITFFKDILTRLNDSKDHIMYAEEFKRLKTLSLKRRILFNQ